MNDEVNAANEADIPDDRKRNTAGAAGGVNGDQGADPDPQVHAGDERRNNPPHHLTLKGKIKSGFSCYLKKYENLDQHKTGEGHA